MADVPGIYPGLIQQEEVSFKSAVSEYTAGRMAQFFNFLALKEHSEKQFFINGSYGIATIPYLFVDGMTIAEFDMEIFNAWIFNAAPGSSGSTEIDIKIESSPGSGWFSIFSTTPKIDSTAIAGAWIGVGGSLSGCVAPVLTSGAMPLFVAAGSALRCDLIQAMPGAQNCGLLLHYRPR